MGVTTATCHESTFVPASNRNYEEGRMERKMLRFNVTRQTRGRKREEEEAPDIFMDFPS